MKFLTIAFTREPKQPPLPAMNYEHARSLTAEFWHGMALGAVIGAGLLAAVLAAIGRF